MKKIIILMSSLAFLLSSCDLDKEPVGAVKQDKVLKTVADAEAFDRGFYTGLRGNVYGPNNYQDIQGDILHASAGYGNFQGSIYRWTMLNSDETIENLWAGYYGSIQDINFVLDRIDNIPTTGLRDETILARCKADAHFLRAFYYHQLVKLYSKDYEPTTASTDLGIPIEEHYDLSFNPTRSSVEQTYQFILKDIVEAKKGILTEGVLGSTSLTVDCITALEARVYLSMHKYAEAAQAANSLISGGKYPLVTTPIEMKNMWHKDSNNESILQLFTSVSESANTNDIFLRYNASARKYVPLYIPEQWVVGLYDMTNDIRGAVYLAPKGVRFVTGDNTVFLIYKYPGFLYADYPDETKSNYKHKPKVFRIAEMHLIKAEALYKSGNTADAGAALNVLRTARGIGNYTGDLWTAIKTERVREMLCEGTRIDDLKRWGDGFTRGAAQNPSTVVADAVNLSKTVGDDKFVWGIPLNDMQVNPNLPGQQNPGW